MWLLRGGHGLAFSFAFSFFSLSLPLCASIFVGGWCTVWVQDGWAFESLNSAPAAKTHRMLHEHMEDWT